MLKSIHIQDIDLDQTHDLHNSRRLTRYQPRPQECHTNNWILCLIIFLFTIYLFFVLNYYLQSKAQKYHEIRTAYNFKIIQEVEKVKSNQQKQQLCRKSFRGPSCIPILLQQEGVMFRVAERWAVNDITGKENVKVIYQRELSLVIMLMVRKRRQLIGGNRPGETLNRRGMLEVLYRRETDVEEIMLSLTKSGMLKPELIRFQPLQQPLQASMFSQSILLCSQKDYKKMVVSLVPQATKFTIVVALYNNNLPPIKTNFNKVPIYAIGQTNQPKRRIYNQQELKQMNNGKPGNILLIINQRAQESEEETDVQVMEASRLNCGKQGDGQFQYQLLDKVEFIQMEESQQDSLFIVNWLKTKAQRYDSMLYQLKNQLLMISAAKLLLRNGHMYIPNSSHSTTLQNIKTNNLSKRIIPHPFSNTSILQLFQFLSTRILIFCDLQFLTQSILTQSVLALQSQNTYQNLDVLLRITYEKQEVMLINDLSARYNVTAVYRRKGKLEGEDWCWQPYEVMAFHNRKQFREGYYLVNLRTLGQSTKEREKEKERESESERESGDNTNQVQSKTSQQIQQIQASECSSETYSCESKQASLVDFYCFQTTKQRIKGIPLQILILKQTKNQYYSQGIIQQQLIQWSKRNIYLSDKIIYFSKSPNHMLITMLGKLVSEAGKVILVNLPPKDKTIADENIFRLKMGTKYVQSTLDFDDTPSFSTQVLNYQPTVWFITFSQLKKQQELILGRKVQVQGQLKVKVKVIVWNDDSQQERKFFERMWQKHKIYMIRGLMEKEKGEGMCRNYEVKFIKEVEGELLRGFVVIVADQ